MKKEKTLYDLVSYLEVKILGLKWLELQHKNKKAGEFWELDKKENDRIIEEFTFLLSFIKELPEAAIIKNLIRSPSEISEIADNMLSDKLRSEALLLEIENRKAINSELKKINTDVQT
tara:strand:+ start:893 stop:1246 length:354 start_codon:yes stop_codon:yes gene_type:complete